MEMNYQQVSRMLKAISDPKRLKIVSMLAQKEMGASALLECFSITQPTLSHDMHVLLESGLVKERRMGKHVIYSLVPEMTEQFMTDLTNCLTPAGKKG